jgi:hypothetical protein
MPREFLAPVVLDAAWVKRKWGMRQQQMREMKAAACRNSVEKFSEGSSTIRPGALKSRGSCAKLIEGI